MTLKFIKRIQFFRLPVKHKYYITRKAIYVSVHLSEIINYIKEDGIVNIYIYIYIYISLGIQSVYEMLFSIENICLIKYRQIISDFVQNDTNSVISFETLDLYLQIATIMASDVHKTEKKAFQTCMYSTGACNSNLAEFVQNICGLYFTSGIFSHAKRMECLVRNQSYTLLNIAVSMTKCDV
jgi:hypothetical protein